MNLELAQFQCFIELAAHHPYAKLSCVEAPDLKSLTCILVASLPQQQEEESFYREHYGFSGEFMFVETLNYARMMVATDKGFLPIEGIRDPAYCSSSIVRIPLYRNGAPVRRNYCTFWKNNKTNFIIEEFAGILSAQFN